MAHRGRFSCKVALVSILPSCFVAHGAPTLALDARKGADLRGWAQEIPRPRAIVAISAHWETRAPAIGTTETQPLMYDFGGFPRALYEVEYPAPGAPDVAARVSELLAPLGAVERTRRGLDHGVWVPLVHMYPDADIPVLQVSLVPEAFEMGRLLLPLRQEGVLLLASGVLVHNLEAVDFGDRSPTPSWAVEFDGWCEKTLRTRDFEALADWRRRAPHADLAQPTDDHFAPILVACGASPEGESVRFPMAGFEFGSLSRRSVQFG
jgi:4,5-DOPA dioxygenase extradiol